MSNDLCPLALSGHRTITGLLIDQYIVIKHKIILRGACHRFKIVSRIVAALFPLGELCRLLSAHHIFDADQLENGAQEHILEKLHQYREHADDSITIPAVDIQHQDGFAIC